MEDWIELSGYVASGMVFGAFWMKMMTPLRFLALGSNILFAVYGLWADVIPVIVLHAALFPLNLYRLVEMMRLIRKVRGAVAGEFDVDWILPLMSRARYQAGDVVFRKGDAARDLYYIAGGETCIEELGLVLPSGQLFGEIGMFSPSRMRTQTVVCKTDCELLRLSYDNVEQLYYQSPEFGFYLVNMITARLIGNKSLQSAEMAL